MADTPLSADEIHAHLTRLDSYRKVDVGKPDAEEVFEIPADDYWEEERLLRYCFPDASDAKIKAVVDRLERIKWEYAENCAIDTAAGDDL